MIRVLHLNRCVLPLIRFTRNIQRHIACPDKRVEGGCVREALDAYFQSNDKARGYVLEDDGALRQHMAVFINGKPLCDRTRLSDAVERDATIDVFQALSGG